MHPHTYTHTNSTKKNSHTQTSTRTDGGTDSPTPTVCSTTCQSALLAAASIVCSLHRSGSVRAYLAVLHAPLFRIRCFATASSRKLLLPVDTAAVIAPGAHESCPAQYQHDSGKAGSGKHDRHSSRPQHTVLHTACSRSSPVNKI